MKIAIDSSNQLTASGMISGRDADVDEFYQELCKIFSEDGIKPPFHWSKLSRKSREKIGRKIVELVNNSKMKFNIFHHLKPKGANKKEYYLRYIPNVMAQHLEPWLQHREGSLDISVDNDYNISGMPNGTWEFVKNFMSQISSRVSGKYFEPFKEGGKFRGTIKHPKGNILQLYGRVSTPRDCKELQIIDLVLGCALNSVYNFDEKKVHIRKI